MTQSHHGGEKISFLGESMHLMETHHMVVD